MTRDEMIAEIEAKTGMTVDPSARTITYVNANGRSVGKVTKRVRDIDIQDCYETMCKLQIL